jgi:starch synthase
MEILMVTPEVIPFSRAGGLADVSCHLALSLAARGHRVRIITPRYRQVLTAGQEITPLPFAADIPMSVNTRKAVYSTAKIELGTEVVFVGCDALFDRDHIYGSEFGDYEDNAERYIFFSRAVMEYLRLQGLSPSVIHCHDWPTGLVPVYLKTLYRSVEPLAKTATLFTFHNLGAQGIFSHYDYHQTGLSWEYFTPKSLEFHGRMNLAKSGLVFSDVVSTVSRKYAREVLTPEYGFGLEGVLRERIDDTYSVLNGVNYRVWDPSRDTNLAAAYSPVDLGPKARCREDLAAAFSLARDGAPIVAVVSRLVDRKGIALILEAMNRLLALNLKFVFLGTGEDKYHVRLTDLARAYPDRIGLRLDYEHALAHRIVAGADMFLIPSKYEPCGLEQLYSMKYGTVPVVRATGGLDDTVIDHAQDPARSTGFKFEPYTADALCGAMGRAVSVFQDKEAWTGLMLRGMSQDFSWSRVAVEYEKLYELALGKIGGN